MRDEFPILAELRRPAVASEPFIYAFLSGLGAGPVVGGITRVAFLWLAPLLFPATAQRPDWLTPNNIVVAVGAVATGAVLMRAGGIVVFATYLGYELVRVFAALPARVALCANSGPIPRVAGCDIFALLAERWVTWAALLVGAVLGIAWVRARAGQNGLLRAAGAFSLTLVVESTLVGLVFLGRSDQTAQNAILALFAVANVIAGAAAGVLLARERFAAALLLVLLILAPGLSLALPLAEQSANTLPFALRWSGVYVPALAALALFAVRGFVRTGDRGTFF